MGRSSSFCLCLAALLSSAYIVASVTPLDGLKPIRQYSRRLSSDQLRESLEVSSRLLWGHNKLDNRLESKPLRHYVSLIDQVLQQDCCDYFAALPLVKNLTDGLLDVLELRLPHQLYPTIRRSYVASIWLLQRSKLFRWNTRFLQKTAMLGFYRYAGSWADSQPTTSTSSPAAPVSAENTSAAVAPQAGKLQETSQPHVLNSNRPGDQYLVLVTPGTHATLRNYCNRLQHVPGHQAAWLNHCRLYEAHVDISAGRPISFHHISKSGGTSLCKIAQANGCKGPPMNRAANCILNTGLDGPIWSLKHDVLAANGIPQEPPPASPPPSPPPPPPQQINHKTLHPSDDDDDDDHGEYIRDELFNTKPAIELPSVPLESYQWFMYDCSKMLPEKAAYGCRERQEAAVAKSATFFANEHALSTQHGKPQVCSSFTNMVMLRDPLSEVVSLMGEVIQVYTRLLRRQRVNAWQPPRWDLSWWQQHAPVVIGSYSSRTLLGAPAFCPPHDTSSQQVISSQSNSPVGTLHQTGRGSSSNSDWLVLSKEDMQTALEQLYEFDLVLTLGAPDLIDLSVSKLLGWSGQMFSERPRERRTAHAKVLTWQQLHQLTVQEPPAESAGAAHPRAAAVDGHPLDPDLASRMIAEVRIRKAYADSGVQYVVTPLLSSQKPPKPPPFAARAAAMAALRQVNDSIVEVLADRGEGGDVLVQLQASGSTEASMGTSQQQQAPVASQEISSAISSPEAAGNYTNGTTQLYHIWPRHGVVLDDQQYRKLLSLTASDRQLHEHAQVLQLLDAAWLSALSRHRGYAKLVGELIDGEEKEDCGFAGS